MAPSAGSLLVMLALSFIAVLADYCLKRASEIVLPIYSWHFLAGIGLYAGSAFGWVYALRSIKLATAGAIFSVTVVVLLAVIGTGVFREPLSNTELLGLACAVASLILLCRFA
jgi:small multidrug resistance pump